ncbi:MAG TPA: FlgD immunoglobulin-like domain containing protein [Candidatus Krumholzibacteria bacterium]|nr:FlgD immunoglobulin-like domain containing protein [Candidatus Krumholzibacteria bacterium]HPD70393.1 FlgD immunoglobulin-like domain containing protein [Candidatus Krumholzibacteria bacterium]HRY39907.1 FlgD immunoglobulin-like domain containing protein [Candidatus Krumholzibacteria bacterium]
MKYDHLRCLLLASLLAGALAGGPLLAADLYVGPGQTYTTIQAAVDAAATSGDVIHVDPGTYVEQVLIDGKDLTLTGAGQGSTLIASPLALSVFYNDGTDHYPVVGVQDGLVDIDGLTVDGGGAGNAHVRFYGIHYHNAGGSVQDVTVVHVRNEPLDGVPHGVAISLYNDDATARSFAVSGCLVQDYQINAMAVITAAGTPLTLSLNGNATVGAGPTGAIVQNGIQVTGGDIVATLAGNTVDDLAWLGDTFTATGLLLQDCSGSVTGDTLVACQTGVNLNAASLSVSSCDITVGRPTDFGHGVVLDNFDPTYTKSARSDWRLANPFAPEKRVRRAAKATLAMAVTGNSISLDPSLDASDGTVGLLAENRLGYDDLDVTATGNTFTGFATAAIAAETTPTSGAWLAAGFGDNVFQACDAGIVSELSIPVAAELCWWGAVDGPGGGGPGSGSTVSGNVDFDPWFTEFTNLVCSPDTLILTETDTTGTVVFEYTGGASGRIYGYSIHVAWDPAVALATADDFQRPPAGAFAGANFFSAEDLDPGHVRIDAALGGSGPGVYADQLFQGAFTFLASAADSAETVFTITVSSIRDNQNHELAGLVPDPGRVFVDSRPVVQSVLVTDTTIGSVDWTGDGHAISVVASLVESSLAALTCDLAAFGGPVLELGDATVEGDQYTWTFAATSGTGDGLVTATVTATDTHAANVALGDAITADNTGPAPLGALTVTPGHQQIHLAWTAPGPDGGSPLQGVEFRYVTWGGYPAYAGPLPAAPAAITEGASIGAGLLGETTYDWAVAPRDVYVIAGFGVDLVGNPGALGATGAATNYWLGDVDGDGYVEPIVDVTALGDTYGLSLGEPGYDAVCDVGPTMDYSPRGVPDPETDGYQIQFEDMMVFALNFGEVDPALKFAPSTPPDLRWEQRDERTWVLELAEPCSGLKGVNLRANLPDGVHCQVTAGALLDAQSTPVFLRNIAAHGLDAGLAAIGFGAAITGSGELLRVTVDPPVEQLNVAIGARDLNNVELLVDLTEPTGVEVPAAHQLNQNVPNPFNPQTTITFSLPRAGHVHLAVYSVNGRLVATLLDEERQAGLHAVTWSGRDDAGQPVATGTYFYALRAGDFRQVRKMTLAK